MFIRFIGKFNSLCNIALQLSFIIILVSSANIIEVAVGFTALGKSFALGAGGKS